MVRCPWGAHGPKRDRGDTVKMVAENDGEHHRQHALGCGADKVSSKQLYESMPMTQALFLLGRAIL
jgi:hypothetical protein